MVMICGACAGVRGAGDGTERGWHDKEGERVREGGEVEATTAAVVVVATIGAARFVYRG